MIWYIPFRDRYPHIPWFSILPTRSPLPFPPPLPLRLAGWLRCNARYFAPRVRSAFDLFPLPICWKINYKFELQIWIPSSWNATLQASLSREEFRLQASFTEENWVWTNIDRLQTIEWYCASFVWKSVIAYVGLLLAERHCMFFEHNCWNFNEHISFGACLDWEVLRVKACSSISRCSRCWTLGN